MSSIDRRQGPGTAPRALGPASDSAHPSSSEPGGADGGAGARAQDHDWSRSYSAGSGPQYGEPSGYGRFESGLGGVPQPPRQMLIVVLLALFAGLFGLHNFYLGYTNRGLAQLLVTVCTLGFGAPIVWLWAIVELILIVTRSGSYAFDAFGRPLV